MPSIAESRAARALTLLALAVAIGGCAQMPSGGDTRPADKTPERATAPPLAPTAEPPPPPVNLSGFPLSYRQGYADGCASATGPERKDATRNVSDGNYRVGWQDGLALCRRK